MSERVGGEIRHGALQRLTLALMDSARIRDPQRVLQSGDLELRVTGTQLRGSMK